MNETATTLNDLIDDTKVINIEIATNNSAFGDADGNVGEPAFIAREVARILRELADKLIERPSLATTLGTIQLRDFNGNVVGSVITQEV